MAGVLPPDGPEPRTCGTMSAARVLLSDGLRACGCPQVARERTGDSWKPVFHRLDSTVAVLVVTAQHVKAGPGRKTDVRAAAWLAEGSPPGLLRASCMPPVAQRERRDLPRSRSPWSRERATGGSRGQKRLADANIQRASVATDILGVSGRARWAAWLAGPTAPGPWQTWREGARALNGSPGSKPWQAG